MSQGPNPGYDFWEHVDEADLNIRAWVLQERLLSIKVFYF